MPSIRVLHFGLGPIGAAIVKQVAARPGLKIVGAVDVDPALVGRDLGDAIGLQSRLGVKVHDDAAKALKAARPDIVLHCTDSSIRKAMPQLEIRSAGVLTVSALSGQTVWQGPGAVSLRAATDRIIVGQKETNQKLDRLIERGLDEKRDRRSRTIYGR